MFDLSVLIQCIYVFAPFVFAIFPNIKRQLKGARFDILKDLQTAVNGFIKSTTSDWYEDIIIHQWFHATKDVFCIRKHILKSVECDKTS
jgi:hypothetical protein